jgi:hypothetical protein
MLIHNKYVPVAPIDPRSPTVRASTALSVRASSAARTTVATRSLGRSLRVTKYAPSAASAAMRYSSIKVSPHALRAYYADRGLNGGF